jgi:Fe-S-cluster containining protein
MQLHQIQQEVHRRATAIEADHGAWPCRKGCADCCRGLAAEPRISEDEWLVLSAAIAKLPTAIAASALQRIRQSAGQPRPVVCPLLDEASSSCLVYEARPIACRTYGFYAEREAVLGCHQIESLGEQSPGILWGNHAALNERLSQLGQARELSTWLESESR